MSAKHDDAYGANNPWLPKLNDHALRRGAKGAGSAAATGRSETGRRTGNIWTHEKSVYGVNTP